jgi:hypothetical protein
LISSADLQKSSTHPHNSHKETIKSTLLPLLINPIINTSNMSSFFNQVQPLDATVEDTLTWTPDSIMVDVTWLWNLCRHVETHG